MQCLPLKQQCGRCYNGRRRKHQAAGLEHGSPLLPQAQHDHARQTARYTSDLGAHSFPGVMAIHKPTRLLPVTAAAAPTTAIVSTEPHVGLLPTTIEVPGSVLRLIHPKKRPTGASKLMVFLPGTDGTGQAILPQLDSLQAAGYDVYCLYIPPKDRSDWWQLRDAACNLITQLIACQKRTEGNIKQVTLLGESFGGSLALLVTAAAPHLVEQVVLLNPATCFNQSLGGLSAFVSATNLLSIFPPALYQVAQATLLPLLVDSTRLVPRGSELMRAMIDMIPADDPRTHQPLPGGRFGAWPLPPELAPSEIAAAANFRANLLREGAGLSNNLLARINTPVLLLASARDRLFPSIQEGARLQRYLRNARRVILPDSGHAAMLERGIDVASLMRNMPTRQQGAGTRLRTQPPQPSQQTPSLPQPVFAASTAAPVTKHGPAAVVSSLASSSNGVPAAVASSAANMAANAAQGAATVAGAVTGTAEVAATDGAPSTSSPAGKARTRKADSGDIIPAEDIDTYDEWFQILAPWRDLVSPVVLGFDHLPAPGSPGSERPMLFVGNHQRVGFYDTPLLVYELSLRGYRVRGLAHPNHWLGPVGPFFAKFGSVKASPMAAYKLLKNNEKVLLFPGGAREVCKPKDANYKLMWKEEPDFVRLAAKCGALIVPFAAVGADDAYEVMMDTDEIVDHPVLGPLARQLTNTIDPNQSMDLRETIMPITRLPGIGLPSPVPIPNLDRLYFKIAEPIDTRGRDLKDMAAMAELYGQVRHTVEQSMNELLEYRAGDKGAHVSARVAGAVSRFSSLMANTTIGAQAQLPSNDEDQP